MLSKPRAFALPLAALSVATILVVLSTAQAAVAGPKTIAHAVASGLCYHTDPSDWHCPDSSRFAANASSITKLTVTIVDKSGKTLTMDLPAGTDAVFFSGNAVKNFLIRYYRDSKQTGKMRELTAYLSSHTPKP